MAIKFLPNGEMMVEFTPEERLEAQMADAYAKAEARTASPRHLGAGINLDSPEALDRELFQPIRREFGLPEPVKPMMESPRLFEIGNRVVAVDPKTGQNREIYSVPEKPPVEKPVKWKFESGRFVKPDEEVLLTPSSFAEQLPTLPEFARTNAANLAQLRGFGFDTGGQRFQPTAASPTVSTPSSRSPYPDGTRLMGKDGRRYVVKGGLPVPE